MLLIPPRGHSDASCCRRYWRTPIPELDIHLYQLGSVVTGAIAALVVMRMELFVLKLPQDILRIWLRLKRLRV